MDLDRFRCFNRTQRSSRRTQCPDSSSGWRASAWRLYVTQPVRNELSSATYRPKLTPRLRRVISPTRSFARSRLLGAIVSRPPGRMRCPRNLRSLTGAAALLARLTRGFSRPSRNVVNRGQDAVAGRP